MCKNRKKDLQIPICTCPKKVPKHAMIVQIPILTAARAYSELNQAITSKGFDHPKIGTSRSEFGFRIPTGSDPMDDPITSVNGLRWASTRASIIP